MAGDVWTDRIYRHPSTAGYWDTEAKNVGTLINEVTSPAYIPVNRCSLVFTRTTPTGTREDIEATHVDFTQVLLANSLAYLSSGQMAAMETALTTLWTTIKTNIAASTTLLEYRWHRITSATTKTGPAERVTAVSAAGTGAGSRLPDQISMTSTLTTAARKHWGRQYWPGWQTSAVSTDYGRIGTGQVDLLAGAVRALANTADTAGTPVVVYSPRGLAVLTVKTVQVDNIWDVIRSRRAKQPSYKKIYTA